MLLQFVAGGLNAPCATSLVWEDFWKFIPGILQTLLIAPFSFIDPAFVSFHCHETLPGVLLAKFQTWGSLEDLVTQGVIIKGRHEGDLTNNRMAPDLDYRGGYGNPHVWWNDTEPYTHCIGVDFLVLILYNSYVRCNHWGTIHSTSLNYLCNFLLICNFKLGFSKFHLKLFLI